jgi:hypothetical protein
LKVAHLEEKMIFIHTEFFGFFFGFFGVVGSIRDTTSRERANASDNTYTLLRGNRETTEKQENKEKLMKNKKNREIHEKMMKVMKKKKQKKKIWNILREIWNWAQGQNLSFRGFWKLMEFNGKFNLKFNLMDVRITVRILIFGVSRVKMLIFLIFCAEAYTCWSARFARSRVGGVARLFKEISVFFFGIWYFFSFRVFWSF